MTAIMISKVLKGEAALGSVVTIQGWVRTRRSSKADGGLSFVNVHDGSCNAHLQIVARHTLDNYETDILKLTSGCSVRVTGKIVQSAGKGQSVEIDATSVEVVGWVDDPETYPMQPKRHTREFLREVAHLRPRTNLIGAITRVRHTIAHAIHDYFHRNGFFWINTPLITGSDTEGAGEMFRVTTLDLVNLPRTDQGAIDFGQDFFGKETFLTVSGQLPVEPYCLSMSKVYTFGPTFRAENSNTKRHLAEFWMVEPEIAFADLSDDADLAEDFLKAIFRAVLETRSDDMAFFAKKFVNPELKGEVIARLERFVEGSFERLTYTEAVDILQKSKRKFEFPVTWGINLQSEHERFLCEHCKGPVVVLDYPKDIKAFYMRLNDDHKTVAAMDVLAPGIGEIIGGSQREERLDVLDARIAEMDLDAADYWWYRDLRRYGTVPHAGFGLGFERCVSYVTGIDNVRDVIPYPRTPKHAEF